MDMKLYDIFGLLIYMTEEEYRLLLEKFRDGTYVLLKRDED